jgi:hypothetical protein
VNIGCLGEEVVAVISQAIRRTTIGHFASVETTSETILSADLEAVPKHEVVYGAQAKQTGIALSMGSMRAGKRLQQRKRD